MKKREFLKTSMILGAGAMIASPLASSCMNSSAANGAIASLVATDGEGKFVQPELGYAFDALEPHLDAMTMEIHYGKHHAGYTRNLDDLSYGRGIRRGNHGIDVDMILLFCCHLQQFFQDLHGILPG